MDIIKLVSDGFDEAKAGNSINVYNNVYNIFISGQLPPKSHYPFGWIIYYALHQSPDFEIESRKRMLATYLKLSVKVPHKLHSMILTEALRLYKDAQNAAFGKKQENIVSFSLVKFLNLWNLNNLREGDWRRKQLEDKTLSSTVEKMITLCIDEFENSHSIPDVAFVDVVDKALISFPDSFNLLSQRASIHHLCSENQQAVSLLQKALLMAPNKFFLWSKLANLINPETDMRLHVALLCKALSSPGPEQFKGRIRLSLAQALLSRQLFDNALRELQRVKSLYEANDWHLPALFYSLSRQIPTGTTPSNPESLYKRVTHLADDFIYNALPAVVMTKNYHKNPDPSAPTRFGPPAAAWRIADNAGNNFWITPHKLGINPDLPMGTQLNVRLFNNKIVKAEVL